MTLVRCRITIAEGHYKRAATHSSVRGVLRWVFCDSLCELDFVNPDEEDVALAAEVTVRLRSRYRYWGHNEVVRDRIVMALVERLQPEYESQVEVEIIDGPDDLSDDSFGYGEDDRTDFGVEVWQVWC